MEITLVIEDDVHLNIAKKVIRETAPGLHIGRILGKRGNAYIKKGIRSFNEASNIVPYIIITDLDTYECPPALLAEWFPVKINPRLYFNIAVKEAEAWLLADRKSFAGFFGISERVIDKNPEAISDPKSHIVNIAKKSKIRAIREGLIPQGTAKVGKLYNTILGDFIRSSWRVFASAENAESLERFIDKIKKI